MTQHPGDEAGTQNRAGAGERAHDAYEQAKDKVSHAYHDARDRASHAYHDARDRAGDAYKAARARASDARQRASSGFDANPLAALAGGLAVGVLIGALLPRTRREAELFGELGRQVGDRARTAAAAARQAGVDKLDELGINKDAARERAASLVDVAKQVAGSAGTAAKQAVAEKDETGGSADAAVRPSETGTGGTSVLGEADRTDFYSGDVPGGTQGDRSQ